MPLSLLTNHQLNNLALLLHFVSEICTTDIISYEKTLGTTVEK